MRWARKEGLRLPIAAVSISPWADLTHTGDSAVSRANTDEVMLSGAVRLAEKLAEQRVRVTLEVWPEMFHVWHQFAGTLPDVDEALDNAACFLDREFKRARLGDAA